MNTNTTLKSMKEIIILLQSSKMENDEKKMWLALLPEMNDEQIVHLSEILRKESNIYIDNFLTGFNY